VRLVIFPSRLLAAAEALSSSVGGRARARVWHAWGLVLNGTFSCEGVPNPNN
jgi:hypothetical protein